MLEIFPIPAFQDNYIWCLHQPQQKQAWVVDPGDAGPVERCLSERGLELAGILITHHHPDHIGGLQRLCSGRELPVYGPDNPRIAGLTRTLADGDEVEVLGVRFAIFETPGHTLDHIVYYAAEHAPPLLFSGDTLFAAGCGRLFEGQPAQMVRSLSRLRELPGETHIFCAHEYTLNNLRFAAAVEPDNTAISARIGHCRRQRDNGHPTLPATLADELQSNPFLRWDQPSVQAAAREQTASAALGNNEVFAAIRQWKDRF